MHQIKVLFLFLFICSSVAIAQYNISDRERIFSELYKFQPSLTSSIAKICRKEADLFSDSGKVLLGEERYTRCHSFDQQGGLDETLAIKDGVLTSHGLIKNKYDEHGNKIESSLYNLDGDLSIQYLYKYDEHGNNIEFSLNNLDWDLSTLYTYKYDEHGNLAEESYDDLNGTIMKLNTYEYKYDEHGNNIEVSEYGSTGNLDNKEKSKYDERGNLIEHSHSNADGDLSVSYTYKYDEHGNKTEVSEYGSTGNLVSKEISQYDEHGNNIEELLFTADFGSIQKNCEYEYDTYLNWTKRTCIEYLVKDDELEPLYDTSSSEVTLHKIEYH